MKVLPLVEVLFVNAVLLAILVLITGNYGLRLEYWVHEGFTPHMARYPFFFITSATNGSTSIPGLLSVDWQQVLVVVVVLVDLVYYLSVVKSTVRPQSSAVPRQ